MRATGFQPRAAATSAAASTSAAAPSLIDEALPAVIVPSFWNAGRSAASFSMSPRPGSSSSATIVGGPLRCAISTGTISPLNFPSACARSARRYDSAANASWSARVIPFSFAHSSAQSPMWTLPYASHRPSWIIESITCACPSR